MLDRGEFDEIEPTLSTFYLMNTKRERPLSNVKHVKARE